MIRPFEPEDTELLRTCLNTLVFKEGLTPDDLIDLVEDYRKRHIADEHNPISNRGPITRTTLQTFLKSAGKDYKRPSQLRDIWNSVASHGTYRRELAALVGDSEPLLTANPPSTDTLETLSRSLDWLLREQRNVVHLFNIETIKKQLPGRYAMYRRDLRSYANHHGPSQTMTVSIVDIFIKQTALCVRETQSFITSNYGVVSQVNAGVIQSYGKYLLGFMNGDELMSFKCLAINELTPYTTVGKVLTFSGQLWVVSGAALFPSTKIFCQRVDNEYNRVGIMPFEEVDNKVALTYITTPVFNPHIIES